MNYYQAVLVGKLSLAMIGVAMLYYLLLITLKGLRRSGASPGLCVQLGAVVSLARATHPYFSTLISLVAIYHVYVMWMTHGLSPKMWSGAVLSLGVAYMANSGWALKARLRSSRLRLAHRTGMSVLLVLAAIHKFI